MSRNFLEKERFNIIKTLESPKHIEKIVQNGTPKEVNLSSSTNTHNTTGKDLENIFSNFITWAKDEKLLKTLANNLSRYVVTNPFTKNFANKNLILNTNLEVLILVTFSKALPTLQISVENSK